MKFNGTLLKEFLDEKYHLYNRPEFIEDDPISIPHLFSKKEDIEIAAFLTAILSWGNRKSIIKSAKRIINLMENSPHDFIMNATRRDMKTFRHFVYRTFNGTDSSFFIYSLRHIYKTLGGLELAFLPSQPISPVSIYHNRIFSSIVSFKERFFSIPHEKRTEKHISDPRSNSACKRLNMFLRWMVRKDKSGVDFGIWNQFSTSELICPLDTHTGAVARKFGLLRSRQDSWKSAVDLTLNLKKFDPDDPVKYDFALFGSGIHEYSG